MLTHKVPFYSKILYYVNFGKQLQVTENRSLYLPIILLKMCRTFVRSVLGQQMAIFLNSRSNYIELWNKLTCSEEPKSHDLIAPVTTNVSF